MERIYCAQRLTIQRVSCANMAAKGQKTGMRGVFLVAAELAGRGFLVSTTWRNAMGADLLVADVSCACAYTVQVKTNSKPSTFWLVDRHAKARVSSSYFYVFLNLRGDAAPEYFVVPSEYVARHMV